MWYVLQLNLFQNKIILKEQFYIQVVPEGSNGCQNQFQGTSAAAPLAAGIIALLLEAK